MKKTVSKAQQNALAIISEIASTSFLEYCAKYEVNNPRITINIDVQDSPERYKMTFERIDLD